MLFRFGPGKNKILGENGGIHAATRLEAGAAAAIRDQNTWAAVVLMWRRRPRDFGDV